MIKINFDNTIKKISIITGHYGCGKTNFSANLALYIRNVLKKPCAIVDLDIVNPYFRTADLEELMKQNDIEMISPMFANTNLDIPALTADIQKIFSSDSYAVVDVGGDDAGAIALGRYSRFIKEQEKSVYFLLNKFRYLKEDLKDDETFNLIKTTQMAARLDIDYLINTSNISEQTTPENIIDGIKYAVHISKKTDIPLVCNAVLKSVDCKELSQVENKFLCERFIKAPWEI